MIEAKELLNFIKKNCIRFFTGVPDSVLKRFITKVEKEKSHIYTYNEGSSVAAGIGYYLNTKKIPCIYLQNSGLGNAINPLISVAHKKVYSIPLLLMIGWRGAPDKKDEPQHIIKGKITQKLLKLLNIKYVILNDKKDLKKIAALIDYSKKKSLPVACLIKKDVIFSKTIEKTKINKNEIYRIKFIENLLKCLKKGDKIISTTGFTSRELFYLKKNYKDINYFYMVGGMGHASSVSLGLTQKNKSNKKIVCLDGDGSVLMHLGSLASIGNAKKNNLKHIILNNNCHESVGSQKTNFNNINLKLLAKAVGYKNYILVKKNNNINKIIQKFLNSNGSSLLEVRIKNQSIKNLPRPNNFTNVKNEFMNKL